MPNLGLIQNLPYLGQFFSDLRMDCTIGISKKFRFSWYIDIYVW
jgi:hypothetical protein